jgi:hypothetical protein
MADRNKLGHNKYRVYVSADSGNTWIPFSGAGAGGTSSTFGAAFPGAGSAAGFKDSTGLLMAPGNLDASGNLKIAGSFSATPPTAATATHSNVAESASSVTVLASNVNRLGFFIYNDSDAAVNLKFAAAASASSFVVRLLPNATFSTKDLPINWTGIITGIWDSTPGTSGHTSARVVELTA